MTRAEQVERACAEVVRGREVVGRRTFMSSMWIGNEPRWIVCTRKTRRVLVHAVTAFDAATWFVDVDPARGVRLPRRRPFDVGTELRDAEDELDRLVRFREFKYQMIDAYYAGWRHRLAVHRAALLRVLVNRR